MYHEDVEHLSNIFDDIRTRRFLDVEIFLKTFKTSPKKSFISDQKVTEYEPYYCEKVAEHVQPVYPRRNHHDNQIFIFVSKKLYRK